VDRGGGDDRIIGQLETGLLPTTSDMNRDLVLRALEEFKAMSNTLTEDPGCDKTRMQAPTVRG
jgi:hypothetical protein